MRGGMWKEVAVGYFKVLYHHFTWRDWGKLPKNLGEISQSCGRDFGVESPKFEVEVLRLVLRYDAFVVCFNFVTLHSLNRETTRRETAKNCQTDTRSCLGWWWCVSLGHCPRHRFAHWRSLPRCAQWVRRCDVIESCWYRPIAHEGSVLPTAGLKCQRHSFVVLAFASLLRTSVEGVEAALRLSGMTACVSVIVFPSVLQIK